MNNTTPYSSISAARLRELRNSGRLGLMLALLSTICLSACAGKPFNVRPRDAVALPEPRVKSDVGPVSVAAEAILEEDRLYDTFDANLHLAGVLPVRVRLSNASQPPVELRKAKFKLRIEDREFKAVSWRRAYKTLMSYYGIATYSRSGYKRSLEDFASHSLDSSAPLASGESRDGLLFFLVPEDISRSRPLILVVSDLQGQGSKQRDRVELKLN